MMTKAEILASAMNKVFSDHSNKYTLEWLLTTPEQKTAFYDAVFAAIPEALRPERPDVSEWYSRKKKVIIAILRKQHESPDNHILSGSASLDLDFSKDSEMDPVDSHPHQQWVTRSEVLALINEIIDKRLPKQEPLAVNREKLLPMPARTKKGRKDDRVHAQIGTCVDLRLKVLFVEEAKRLRMTQSELLDQILFTYFQGPKLTYGE